MKWHLCPGLNTVPQAIYQALQTTKMNFENWSAKKFSKTTFAIRLNESSSCLFIRTSFCISVAVLEWFYLDRERGSKILRTIMPQ